MQLRSRSSWHMAIVVVVVVGGERNKERKKIEWGSPANRETPSKTPFRKERSENVVVAEAAAAVVKTVTAAAATAAKG